MTIKFDYYILQKMRLWLLGKDAGDLIDFMYRKQAGEEIGQLSERTAQIAKDLGWLDRFTGQFTDLGWRAADSCREYKFWLQRDKALPFEGKANLSLNYFADKSVVEIGCGMGANLMSMSGTVHDLIGVEPVEAYIQFGSIFRERERMAQLDVRVGTAEALPFQDDRFDVVLCVAAHHYFDISPALRQFARVLKPGGQLLIIGDTWDTEAWLVLKDLLRRPSRMKSFIVSTLNTLSYTSFGWRILPVGGKATSRPIFPLRGSMNRWLQEAGLILDRPMVRIGPDTCFAARKPA